MLCAGVPMILANPTASVNAMSDELLEATKEFMFEFERRYGTVYADQVFQDRITKLKQLIKESDGLRISDSEDSSV